MAGIKTDFVSTRRKKRKKLTSHKLQTHIQNANLCLKLVQRRPGQFSIRSFFSLSSRSALHVSDVYMKNASLNIDLYAAAIVKK